MHAFKDYFALYFMSDRIRCAHILVKDKLKADELLKRIKDGESFSKIAEENSIDGSRRRGGDLGFFTRGVMVKEFEKAAFALDKGQVSEVIKTQFGYHIIKRLE